MWMFSGCPVPKSHISVCWAISVNGLLEGELQVQRAQSFKALTMLPRPLGTVDGETQAHSLLAQWYLVIHTRLHTASAISLIPANLVGELLYLSCLFLFFHVFDYLCRWTLIICLLVICIIFFGELSFPGSCPFFHWQVDLYLIDLLRAPFIDYGKQHFSVYVEAVFPVCHWPVCLSSCQDHAVLKFCCFAVNFEIESVSSPMLFFFRAVLATQGPLPFHVNFGISLPVLHRSEVELW